LPTFVYYRFLRPRPRPRPTLFPYTTLFRSQIVGEPLDLRVRDPHVDAPALDRVEHDEVEAFAIDRIVERPLAAPDSDEILAREVDRKSTRLNSSHVKISYAVFCLKKKIHTT